MSNILINLGGLVLAGMIVWWFWLYRPAARRAAGPQPIQIIVADGVYTPARIEVPAGEPVTLRFLRRDPSPCAEKALFDGLGISAELPIGQPLDVVVTPPQPGEYEFTCQMRMYRGVLVAK
jgi:plastocyanin domain-containing protein